MSDDIKIWLEKIKDSDKYEVTVDNDNVSISEVNPFEEDTDEWHSFIGEYKSFNMMPEEFLIELLNWIGIKADRA